MSGTNSDHDLHANGVECSYPISHVGHLSTEQEYSLQEFKKCCCDLGYYKPASDHSTTSHDDSTLLRFLRARRFDVPSAVELFTADANWRKNNNIDKVFETMDIKYYQDTRFLYPQWTGRCDRRGIPIFLYQVNELNSNAMAAFDTESKKFQSDLQFSNNLPPKSLRSLALYEDMVRFVMPLCTAVTDRMYPDTPITQCCNLVDLSGVRLKQFWDLRRHMLDTSALANAHYPETLDRIILIGTPSFFPVVWGWIQKWFDPNTTSKILVLGGSDISEKLSSIIEPQNIPKKYNGQLDFKFGDRPQLDAKTKNMIHWEDGWTDFPLSPMYWIDKDETMEAYAVGKDSSSERREKICTIQKSRATVINDSRKVSSNSKLPEDVIKNEVEKSKPRRPSDSLVMTDRPDSKSSKFPEAESNEILSYPKA